MPPIRSSPSWLSILILAASLPAVAQLSGPQSDPLARIRKAAKTDVQACSVTGETLCEQVAPKIIANAQGDSPLAENLRRLALIRSGRKAETQAEVVSWGVAAFHDAGISVHTEKYASVEGAPPDQENVVAEISGREKPEEWVLLGAHLDSLTRGSGELNDSCEAAMVIESARDISSTGIRPRRSIRFVLFTGSVPGTPGTWAYVRSHRAGLDSARASIIFGSSCAPVAGYNLGGRHDIESGVREAMKPVESLTAGNFVLETGLATGTDDFLLEGIPALTTIQGKGNRVRESADGEDRLARNNIAELKRNTAIVAVTAFGIAERLQPVGPRLSRAEMETLLKTTGLDERMKKTGLWPLWESGQRGRFP